MRQLLETRGHFLARGFQQLELLGGGFELCGQCGAIGGEFAVETPTFRLRAVDLFTLPFEFGALRVGLGVTAQQATA